MLLKLYRWGQKHVQETILLIHLLAGHLGVKELINMQDEIIRDMKLMGCRSIDELCMPI